MASTLRNLRIALSLEPTGVEKGAARAQTAMARVEKTFGRLSRVGATLGLAFGAGAIVDFARESIQAASDLGESMSKVNVVFGASGKLVHAFATTSATSMGMSRQSFEEAAGTLGNLFVSMKIGQPEAARMSVSMVKLAGDMASFNNTRPEEALEALRAGLVGETEPLRRFGINLDDAQLRAEAMRLGLGKIGATLTPLQRSQAAYSLILQQSKTAQGDFAHTSGGLANQQRILTAQFEDTKAELGQALLPIAVKVTTWFNTAFIPALRGTIDWLGKHETLVRNVAAALAVGIGVWGAYTAAVKTAAVSSAVIGGISRAVAFLGSAWETLRLKTMYAADAIRTAGGPVQALKTSLGGFGGIVAKAKGALSGLVGVLGGPWGIALAVGATALSLFASRNNEAEAEVEQLTEALIRNNGALDESSIATVKNALDNAGAYKAAERLGLNLSQVTGAALRNGPALAAINSQLEAISPNFRTVAGGARGYSVEQLAVARAAVTVNDAIGGQNTAVGDSIDKYKRMKSATPGTVAAADATGDAFETTGNQAATAAQKIQDLVDATNGFNALRGDVTSTAIAFKNHIDDMREAFKKNALQIDRHTGAFKLNSKANRDNAELVIDAIRKAGEHAAAVTKNTGSVKKGNAAFNEEIAVLRGVLDKQGMSRREIDKLIGKYIDLKKKVNDATGGIRDRTVKIKIQADGTVAFSGPGGRKSLHFAAGGVLPGVLPGWSPGRDIHTFVSPTGGQLGLSGGEAVMRPEWTKAVGPDAVEKMNQAARTGGISGVKKILAAGVGPDRLSGEGAFFAGGGIIAKGSITGLGSVRRMTKRYGKAVDQWADEAAMRIAKQLQELGFGGPGVAKALRWARTQAGKPYIWGGVGPRGYDCSGWISALTNVIHGKYPYSRLFTTHSFGPRGGPGGFVRSRRSGFMVGVTNAGVGHMAGTLGRVNVESSGSRGVRVGGGARGYRDGLFPRWYGLTKFDQGGVLQPGYTPAYNGTGKPEYVFSRRQMELGGGRPVEVHNHFHIPNNPNRHAIAKEIYEVLEPYMQRSGRRLPK